MACPHHSSAACKLGGLRTVPALSTSSSERETIAPVLPVHTQLSCGANAKLALGKSQVSGFMPTPGGSVVMEFQIHHPPPQP